MSHVGEHCRLPRTVFRGVGEVFLCTCGQLWTLQYFNNWWESYKMWVKVDITKLKGSE